MCEALRSVTFWLIVWFSLFICLEANGLAFLCVYNKTHWCYFRWCFCCDSDNFTSEKQRNPQCGSVICETAINNLSKKSKQQTNWAISYFSPIFKQLHILNYLKWETDYSERVFDFTIDLWMNDDFSTNNNNNMFTVNLVNGEWFKKQSDGHKCDYWIGWVHAKVINRIYIIDCIHGKQQKKTPCELDIGMVSYLAAKITKFSWWNIRFLLNKVSRCWFFFSSVHLHTQKTDNNELCYHKFYAAKAKKTVGRKKTRKTSSNECSFFRR